MIKQPIAAAGRTFDFLIHVLLHALYEGILARVI